MQSILPTLLGLALFATLAVVAVGIISFSVHGDFYKKHANNLMRVRIALQGCAVALLAAIVWVSGS
jgi:hypothetical protein